MKVWGVVGWKNSGKTGLMERLVGHFASGGLTVSTIKHTHHAVDLDTPGTDSHRHRTAGAAEVMLASAARWAILREHHGEEPPLEALLARLAPVDLVLVEGFKAGPQPKVEAVRAATGRSPLAAGDPSIRALAADTPLAVPGLPVFHLDDTAAIAAFIAREAGL